MGAAVEDVHHRHRQHVASSRRRRARRRTGRAGPSASAAAARATASETPRIAFAPSRDLFGVPSSSISVLSIAPCSVARAPASAAAMSLVDVRDRLGHALAAPGVAPVAKLGRLELARRGAGGHGGAPGGAGVEAHLDLDRRVPARVEDLAGVYAVDRAHRDACGGYRSDVPLTVVFFPEGAYGPTNNCVGIGDVLRRRGHRVVFIAEESFAGTLEEKGFEERLMRLTPPAEAEEDPGQFWKDFIRDTAPVFRKPTIEQLEGFIAPTFEALCDGARYVDERLVEIIDEVRPGRDRRGQRRLLPGRRPPARPWVRIVSLQSGGGQGPARAAAVLRLSGVADRERLGDLPSRVRARPRAATARVRRVLPRARRAAAPRARVHPLLEPTSICGSTRPRSTTGAATRSARLWHNLESSVRATDADVDAAGAARRRRRPALYLSLGSLGSGGRGADADADLLAGRLPLPRDRLDGPPARRAGAGAEHGRRGVPAADVDPARASTW